MKYAGENLPAQTIMNIGANLHSTETSTKLVFFVIKQNK